jgi:hypothetical protein
LTTKKTISIIQKQETNDKEKEMKMEIGYNVSVEYATGEKFVGEIVSVKYMEGYRLLFTLKIENVGYRSMYLDKCVACNYLATA